MARRGRSFPLPAILSIVLLSAPLHAQSLAEAATLSDEQVRRVVERAMAAIALAEAEASRKVAELQIDLIQKNEEIRHLRGRLESAQTERDQWKDRSDSRAAEIATIRQEYARLRLISDERGAAIERLTKELEQTAGLLNDARTALTSMQDEKRMLGDSILIMRRREADRKEIEHDRMAEIERLAVELRSTADLLGKTQSLLNNFRTENERLGRELEAGTLENVRLTEEYRVRIGEIEELLEATRAENRRLQEEAGSSSAARVGFDERLGETERLLAESRAENREMRESLGSAVALKNRTASENIELKSRIAELHTQIGLMEDGQAGGRDVSAELLAEKENRIDRLEAELREVLEEKTVLAERMRRIESAGEGDAGRRIVALEAEIDALRREAATASTEMRKAIETIRMAEKALQAAYAERDSLSRAAAEMATRVSALEKEIEALRSRPAAAQSPVEPPAAVRLEPETPTPERQPEPTRSGFRLQTASYEELASMPAIGARGAGAIVWYRTNVRPLSNWDELKSVPGFNDEMIKAIRESIESEAVR